MCSEKYKSLEHSINQSLQTEKGRQKRHIGVPDHGGFQRIIATGGLAPSHGVPDENNQINGIDVVFTTYWQYPAKVRVILPEDRACIEHYRNLSMKGNNLALESTESKLRHLSAFNFEPSLYLKRRNYNINWL